MSVTDIYRALAELGYAIAKADGGMQSAEKEEFYRIMQDEIYPNGLLAESRFEILEARGNLTVDQAYKQVLNTIKQNKKAFTPQMREQFLNVMQRIAEAYNGVEVAESELIARFIKDMDALA